MRWGRGVTVRLGNPLRVLIHAPRFENPFGKVQTGEEMAARLDAAWMMMAEVKKVHPDAEISVEIEA